MKLLLSAALRVRKNLTLLFFTFTALICLTVANQMEMFTFGVMANSGADFFHLFDSESNSHSGSVSKETLEKTWKKIDKGNTGVITTEDAAEYLSQSKSSNPLNRVINKIKKKFNINHNNFEAFILLLLTVALFKAVFLFISRFTTQILSVRISRDLRQQYFEHIQKQPMSFYQKYNIGSLSSRVVGDAGQIATSLNSFITNYLHAPFTIFSTLFMCFFMSWQLSLVIFIGLPLIVFPVVFLTRRVKKITRQLQKNQEAFSSVLIDFLAGIQTVKVFAMEAFSFKKYKQQNDRMAHLETKTAKYDLLTRPVLHTITTMCLAVVALFGLYVLKMSLAELIVFCGLLHLFYEPVKKFADENANIQKGVVAAERLYEVLDQKPLIEDKDQCITLSSFEKKIEFDRIWFRYEKEWVLKDVSFSVNKGETVAIIGATGAGKSTIVQLLPRLYEVQKGEIRIDGVPINDFSQRSLRDHIGFVPQKPFLFEDTIGANIAFGRDFTTEQIQTAAKRAHAAEFIENLPEQYDFMLSEMGKNFSGGQQQRLAIARALVKDAPILVLDEATSSLDAVSEHRIKMA
ncbi:MAG: ABC transporter ATP-binding protein, partial [Simkaniaceae bacterium]|nr:ABC transporter ATP-binding protein [Simkaniaceae bacterium]